MSACPRTDSPIIHVFPRRLSEPVTPMASIVEQEPQIFLYSPTIASPELTESGHPYTFLNSSSSGETSPSRSTLSPETAEPLLPLERFPSFLSLENLGYEDENDENDDAGRPEWARGWNIASSGTTAQGSQDMGPVYQPELPKIQEYAFQYKTEDDMRRRNGKDDGSLKLARRRLMKRKNSGHQRRRFRTWLKKALMVLRSRGK